MHLLVVAAIEAEAAHVPDGLEVLVTGVGKSLAAVQVTRAICEHPRRDELVVVDSGSTDATAAVARAAGARVLTYGRDTDADVRIVAESGEGFDWRMSLRDGDAVHDVALHVPGAHNLLNAAGVYTALVHGFGLAPAEVARGLGAFRGTSRRFEPRGEAGGVRVVDDYAHNPGKLDALVRTAAGLKDDGELIVIFQPHLYSRTQEFAAEFAEALSLADEVVVLDVYGAREQPEPGVRLLHGVVRSWK